MRMPANSQDRQSWPHDRSEARLLDVMDHACNDNKDNKCMRFVGDHEEAIEEWYFKHQATAGLFDHLCVDALRLCCAKDRFGPACEGMRCTAQARRA
jgi:hypothetical protein